MNTLPPKHFLTLQLLRCKPSLPQMLRVWSVLTENPSILLQHFMLDSQRTYPNLSVFWLFSRSFFSFIQLFQHTASAFPSPRDLADGWQIFPAVPEQLRRSMSPSPPGTAGQGWHQTLQSLLSSQLFTGNWGGNSAYTLKRSGFRPAWR